MDRKLLTEKLGLDVTATDEEIFAKLAKLQSDADTAASNMVTKDKLVETAENSLTVLRTELGQAKTKITALTGELQTERETHANSLLDAAEASGRITKADRAEWLPKLTGETREAEANTLHAIAPKLNTTALDVTTSRVEIGDEKQRRETISNAVDANIAKGMDYDSAWAAAKKDPALKPVWDAMKTEE
jgi:uncharacterized phage infection (PIP) family protein YhgE